jgi:hypothetical protein
MVCSFHQQFLRWFGQSGWLMCHAFSGLMGSWVDSWKCVWAAALVQPNFFGFLDLNDPGVVDNDLDKAKSE